ncbi:MAG: amino acid ABC transporter ATP-binding protein [Eubacteriales bacterium]|nr:amino acid ABC transporter ATP-binding protein [Eubacteriales bacterium]
MEYMSILSIKHLSKTFGTHIVLTDIDFDVEKKDIISIIGSSGSGKSTILRCINLLEKPTTGDILYNNKSIFDTNNSISSYRSKVGMVFQNFNLFNNMSVLKNCMIGQEKVLKIKEDEAKDTSIFFLKKVGMLPYINAKPRQLSGGQKQRVAIARALCMKPDALLFDEPTSALDPQMVNEVLLVMRDLANEGMTMLIVTHEMAFAKDVSNKILFIHEGHIVEQGSPEEVLKNPKEEKTKDFLKRFIER